MKRNLHCARSKWLCGLTLALSVAVPVSGGGLLAAEPLRRGPIQVSEAARRIHLAAPVFDGHNDLPWALRQAGGGFEKFDISQPQPRFHTDIPRLRRGGVGAQFWSVYVPVETQQQGAALRTTLEQIAVVKRMMARYDDVFELALSAGDIDRIRGQGKIASLIGVEGGHSIENSINVLRQLHREGARYMTLTHSSTLDWADSCSDVARHGGLTRFGEEVVREMNRLGMLIDISHVSPDCMRHALRVTKAPVIFSHSSARAIADHPRNVPNDVLRLTAANRGVVMINFFSSFVDPAAAQRSAARAAEQSRLEALHTDQPERVRSELRKWEAAQPPTPNCTAELVLDHIEHVIREAGIDHVGLGSDFDGVPQLPAQLEDVAAYPVLTQGLLDRGYEPDAIRKILGGNVLRVLREAESASGKASRP